MACGPLRRRPPGAAACALARASVAVKLLHALATLLRFDRQRRHRPRDQARNADGLAGFLAIAIRAILDHPQRLFDLLQQLAFPVAGAQLERVFLLERRAIRRIGRDLVLAQMLARIVGVAQDLVADVLQPLLEESELRLVHVVLLRILENLFLGELAGLLLDGDCGFGGHGVFHP